MAIDCVLCFRDESGKYFINAYVTILSIFENTKEKIVVHILHDETITHGQKHLEDLCASYRHEICFHRVPEFDRHTASTISERFNIGATYMYFAHEFVKSEKVVYLDCDVIVNMDIRKLYDIPMGASIFASTPDYCPYWKNNGTARKKYAEKIKYLGLKPDSYISSGMVLINLDKLRELSSTENIFVKKTLDAINKGIRLDYPDMDILNAVAAMVPDSVLLLDKKFNLWNRALHLGLPELEDTIFHYVTKPDKAFFPAHVLFWKYYAMSPFAGDMFERMSAAYSAKDMDFMKYYVLNPRHRRHAEELLQYGFTGMIKRAIGRKLGLIKK